MPFVTQEHRENIDPEIPGDRCYFQYKIMMDQWKENPRWTTADKILSVFVSNPWTRAGVLAFLVFFCMHVMPYEEQKRKENGDV